MSEVQIETEIESTSISLMRRRGGSYQIHTCATVPHTQKLELVKSFTLFDFPGGQHVAFFILATVFGFHSNI